LIGPGIAIGFAPPDSARCAAGWSSHPSQRSGNSGSQHPLCPFFDPGAPYRTTVLCDIASRLGVLCVLGPQSHPQIHFLFVRSTKIRRASSSYARSLERTQPRRRRMGHSAEQKKEAARWCFPRSVAKRSLFCTRLIGRYGAKCHDRPPANYFQVGRLGLGGTGRYGRVRPGPDGFLGFAGARLPETEATVITSASAGRDSPSNNIDGCAAHKLTIPCVTFGRTRHIALGTIERLPAVHWHGFGGLRTP
jgi:hypothetical protein